MSTPASTRVYYRGMLEILIERAPPKRLLANLRWRSFKTSPDQQVWEQCLAPVVAAIDQGYEITRVHVEWGKGRPFGV